MKEENDPIVCIMSAQRRLQQLRRPTSYAEVDAYIDEANKMLERALVLVKESNTKIEQLEYELQHGRFEGEGLR